MIRSALAAARAAENDSWESGGSIGHRWLAAFAAGHRSIGSTFWGQICLPHTLPLHRLTF